MSKGSSSFLHFIRKLDFINFSYVFKIFSLLYGRFYDFVLKKPQTNMILLQ
jgi:hypothetical protein